MKKIIVQLNAAKDSVIAENTLNHMSGVMVSSCKEDQLVIFCGQRLNNSMLLNALRDKGCEATIVGAEPDSFF